MKFKKITYQWFGTLFRVFQVRRVGGLGGTSLCPVPRVPTGSGGDPQSCCVPCATKESAKSADSALRPFMPHAVLADPLMYQKDDHYGLSEEAISRQRLDALKQRLARKGIQFSYGFDRQTHDRLIDTDDWQILLGRGLDMYYPPERDAAPGVRRAKSCRIVFIPRTQHGAHKV